MSIRELFNAILDFNLLWIVGIVVGIFLIWLLVDMVDSFYKSLPQSGKDFVKVMNSFGFFSLFVWIILISSVIGLLLLIIEFGIYGLKFLEIYFKN